MFKTFFWFKTNCISCYNFLQLELTAGRSDLQDVILSPHPERMFSGKYVFFHPKAQLSSRIGESSTRVPWEEPLKETANIALGNPKIR